MVRPSLPSRPLRSLRLRLRSSLLPFLRASPEGLGAGTDEFQRSTPPAYDPILRNMMPSTPGGIRSSRGDEGRHGARAPPPVPAAPPPSPSPPPPSSSTSIALGRPLAALPTMSVAPSPVYHSLFPAWLRNQRGCASRTAWKSSATLASTPKPT